MNLLVIAVLAISSCSSDNADKKIEVLKPFDDGWPKGLPKDTVVVLYENYPESMKTAILEQAKLNPEVKEAELEIIEVYRNRAWDGKEWYTTENDFSVWVENKNQPEQKWIVSLERKRNEYHVNGWDLKGY